MTDEYDIWDEDDYRFPVAEMCPVCKIPVWKYPAYADLNIHFNEKWLDGANRIFHHLKYWLPKIPKSNKDLSKKHVHFTHYDTRDLPQTGKKPYSLAYYKNGVPCNSSIDDYDSLHLNIPSGIWDLDEYILQILLEATFPYTTYPNENNEQSISYSFWENRIETLAMELLQQYGGCYHPKEGK